MKVFLAMALMFVGVSLKAADAVKTQTTNLSVTEKGFEPDKITVKPGTHLVLKVTRKTNATCATEIVIKDKKIKQELPLNKEVSIDVGVLAKGKVSFACGMDMISGVIVTE